ncbi:hypothetical protein [Phytomonospora endophytica]|uniref:Putative glyoxalase superfamily protein PhnB n=1 Tax=Phytomonospora endophytica TaxID=714109 RepID=A0A841FK51_9ACTN|nr:hypothetical protein [Phytomonospora endophytica]MBB6033942.1 putative glyoxalase superfamily protein PhnB [Phytomonospora endophytica]GIG64537.1 hypothetical protein Pen01_08320 [Phytomonospora endophytica]
MLSVILACDDPLETAGLFTSLLGWNLVFASPPDADDLLACVELGGAQVMLGSAGPEFLPEAARAHRGAGAEIYIRLPPGVSIDAIHTRHADAGVVTRELEQRAWGEWVFQARIEGYRFMIAQEPVDS